MKNQIISLKYYYISDISILPGSLLRHRMMGNEKYTVARSYNSKHFKMPTNIDEKGWTKMYTIRDYLFIIQYFPRVGSLSKLRLG